MPTKTGIKISTVSYAIVYVKDTAKAVPFYRDVLGLKPKSEVPGWVEFETGATTLALHQEENPKQHNEGSRTVLVFPVDCVDEAHDVLKANSVKILKAPNQVCETPTSFGFSVDFEDVDGNTLSLYSEKKK